jgi:hypothetical protein
MPTTHISQLTAAEAGELEATARAVLDDNWLGASTVASRSLSPHQWSWDSAFIAIGRSWYDQQPAGGCGDLGDHPAAAARGRRAGGLPARRRPRRPWPSWSGCTPG